MAHVDLRQCRCISNPNKFRRVKNALHYNKKTMKITMNITQ